MNIDELSNILSNYLSTINGHLEKVGKLEKIEIVLDHACDNIDDKIKKAAKVISKDIDKSESGEKIQGLIKHYQENRDEYGELLGKLIGKIKTSIPKPGGQRYIARGQHGHQSISGHQSKKQESGEGHFEKSKLLKSEALHAPKEIAESSPFPQSPLVRVLTGDVPAEFLEGLGRWKNRENIPKELLPKLPKHRARKAMGKDVFVTAMDEIAKKTGKKFDPKEKNDPIELSKALDLGDAEVEKVKGHGLWLFQIHPGSKLAIPTGRLDDAGNKYYKEGGFTASGMQEWVTVNVRLEDEARRGNIKIYKINSEGTATEWRFFQGKLYPIDELERAIESAIQKPLDKAQAPEKDIAPQSPKKDVLQ